MNKPKTPQPKTPDSRQSRDYFQTPAYAVDLLIPFIPGKLVVWEPAMGEGNILNTLQTEGFESFGTDLPNNFLEFLPSENFDAIITNPPFSLKREFVERCLALGKPFALLILTDDNQWLLRLTRDYGLQWIKPVQRINYVTPDLLEMIFKKSTLENVNRTRRQTGEKKKLKFDDLTADQIREWGGLRYQTIYDVPLDIFERYSGSQFHTGWLTYKFNLPQQINIVEMERTRLFASATEHSRWTTEGEVSPSPKP